MSESEIDSGHDTTSTLETAGSSNVHPSLTVGRIPQPHKAYTNEIDVLPQLPSHKFRYSVWHDLRQTCLTGDQLHAPRVRAGPPEKDKFFHKIEEDGIPIHHNIQKSSRKSYMNEFENWEKAKTVNLCYQELSDDYQWANFYRILERCVSAEILNLSHNTIVTLDRITFPSCEYLNLNSNYIKTFKGFPSLPKVKSVTAQNNAISSVAGIKRLAGTPLQELDLKGNPVCFLLNYRQVIFNMLPNLQILDGIPKMAEDTELVEPREDDSRCTIL